MLKNDCNKSPRKFLNNLLKLSAGAMVLQGAPTIVHSTVFGKNAPSNKINIGQIGYGRIARTHNLPETFKNDIAHIIAIADMDKKRQDAGKKLAEGWYTKKPATQITLT